MPDRSAERRLVNAVRLAFGTLTRVPVRPPREVTPRVAQPAMLMAPLTAVPLALVWVIAAWAAQSAVVAPLLAATVSIAATAAWSRGLHLDGLADTADGLGSGYDRGRALEVMHRSDIGPTGVVTLVLTLLVQVVSLAPLLPSRAGAPLAVTALLVSRLAVAVGCWARVPVARTSGLGAAVGRSVSTPALAGLDLAALVLAGLASAALGSGWYGGVLVTLAALLATAVVLRIATRRLGGMTGDVLGAAVELALAGALVVASLVSSAA